MVKDGNWSFAGIWNQALDINPQREYEPRTHIWASELGGSYYDRYMKMKGRKPTTPPNLRSRRKFEGGNLTEWIVQQILARAGVLRSTQEYITYDGDLRVTGKADFTAGGIIKALDDNEVKDLPETFGAMAQALTKQLNDKYPDGLRDVNLEIKSCSGLMFDRYLAAPSQLHGLQAFHYAYNTGRPTMLVYVSRDDFRIAEWIILPKSQKWLKLYEDDIKRMKATLDLNKKYVPKEPLLVYIDGKFSKNWKVEYSSYLTDYGYKRPELYAKPAQSISMRLNNIVKKLKADKELSNVNLKTLKECYAFYPEAEQIINQLKEK